MFLKNLKNLLKRKFNYNIKEMGFDRGSTVRSEKIEEYYEN